MYYSKYGASYDGLEDKRININQGAESTLCFFKTQIIMEQYVEKVTIDKPNKTLPRRQLNINFTKILECTCGLSLDGVAKKEKSRKTAFFCMTDLMDDDHRFEFDLSRAKINISDPVEGEYEVLRL